jgi:hypothetical protein
MRQSGLPFGQGLREWNPDIWPDFDAPALLPDGDSAAAVMGTYGFWPKFLQPERRNDVGRKMQPFSTYNARGEEVGMKRLYAAAWRAGQRCLIPASFVVEPCYPDARQDEHGKWILGRNVWHRCGLADGSPFAVAGIWKRYATTNGQLTVAWATNPVVIAHDLTVCGDSACQAEVHLPLPGSVTATSATMNLSTITLTASGYKRLSLYGRDRDDVGYQSDYVSCVSGTDCQSGG